MTETNTATAKPDECECGHDAKWHSGHLFGEDGEPYPYFLCVLCKGFCEAI